MARPGPAVTPMHRHTTAAPRLGPLKYGERRPLIVGDDRHPSVRGVEGCHLDAAAEPVHRPEYGVAVLDAEVDEEVRRHLGREDVGHRGPAEVGGGVGAEERRPGRGCRRTGRRPPCPARTARPSRRCPARAACRSRGGCRPARGRRRCPRGRPRGPSCRRRRPGVGAVITCPPAALIARRRARRRPGSRSTRSRRWASGRPAWGRGRRRARRHGAPVRPARS